MVAKSSLGVLICLLAGFQALHGQEIDYLPASTTGQVVDHTYYTLSYNEEHEQAEWVAYYLTKGRIKGEVSRTNDYRKDPKVKTGTSANTDHKGSGYDRGHLAPAASMAFSEKAMRESFYLSNMSPQHPALNRGPWRKLEKQVRRWTKKHGPLYVVSGPVLSRVRERIGPNDVSVPQRLYKVILDYNKGRGSKGIAFLLPNKPVKKELSAYKVPIDKVEAITGIDFFHELPVRIQSSFEREVAKNWQIAVSRDAGGSYGSGDHYTDKQNKININKASSEMLQKLYGIGPARAKAIIKVRPYHHVSELTDANGIGPAIFKQIKPYVKAGNPQKRQRPYQPARRRDKLNLNRASRAELKDRDGIGEVLSGRIIKARPFQNVNDLKSVKGIGPKTVQDLKSQVMVP